MGFMGQVVRNLVTGIWEAFPAKETDNLKTQDIPIHRAEEQSRFWKR